MKELNNTTDEKYGMESFDKKYLCRFYSKCNN
jgi:hypothetical protein